MMEETGVGNNNVAGVDAFELANYQPETIMDNESFQPLKGKYECRIDEVKRMNGTSQAGKPYDFFSLKLQVTETVEGDKGENRFLSKNYSNDAEGRKKLADALFTSGLEYAKTGLEDFMMSLAELKDKTMLVSAWYATKDRTTDSGYEIKSGTQYIKIVKDFKLGKKKDSGEDKGSKKVPF